MAPAGHPFLVAEHPIALAHRGGDGPAPENTLAAFEHAVAHGYRYLETDVRATRDGVLVTFHDASLRRLCGLDDRVADVEWARLRQVRVAGHPIATLEEALASWPDVRFNVDAKSWPAVAPLVRVARRPAVRDRICIASFSPARLREVRRSLGPRACTALSPVEDLRLVAAAAAGVAPGRFGGQVAQLPVTRRGVPVVTPRLVERAHRSGLAVHAWTVNDEPTMVRTLDAGVDGIISDRLALLRSVLRSRGQWG